MADPQGAQTMEVVDFTGGKTDFYIDGPPNKYQDAVNKVINRNGKLITRDGTQVDDETYYQVPYGAKPVRALNVLNDYLIKQSGKNLYVVDGGWVTIDGPTSNPCFNNGGDDTYSSYDTWNDHLFCANDALSEPQRVYKDSDGNWQTNNIGLPNPSLIKSYELANDIKAKYNTHIADAAEHGSGADGANAVTAADAYNYDTLVTLINDLIAKYDAHEGDAELGAAWAYHNAQEATDHSLASLVAPTSLSECLVRLKDIKAKFDAHDADATAHTAGSTHQVAEFFEPQVSKSGAGNNYVYAFHFEYEYRIGDLTFRENSSVSYLSEAVGINDPGTTTVTVSSLPTIANGSTHNYDTTNIKLWIFRNQNDGDTWYKVGEVTNGTTTFVDSTSDSDLTVNNTLYIDGGQLDFEQPPDCKYIFQAGGTTYYCHVKEGSNTFPNKIRPSIINQPSACPGSFGELLDDEIVGAAAIGRFGVVFCKNDKIYRIEGAYDSLGNGNLRQIEIPSETTLVSNRSIVKARNGLFFAGSDGFYFTNGYSVKLISKDLPESYAALVATEAQAACIVGTYDSTNSRIYWSAKSDVTKTENDITYVMHLDHIREGMNYPCTTHVGYNPTSLAFYDNAVHAGVEDGYTLYLKDGRLSDTKIDTSAAPANWKKTGILYDYRSCSYSFGTQFVRSWVPKLVVSADNAANLSLAIWSNNDNSGVFKQLKGIRTTSDWVWGDPTFIWGPVNTTFSWNYFEVIEQWRRFPKNGLRCSYKQIRLTNDFITVDSSSETSELGDIDATAKTVTLDGGSTKEWIDDAEDYYIYFEADGYTLGYLVTDRTAKVLTYSDAANDSVTATDQNWIVKGYVKEEVLNLLGYAIQYAQLTTTQATYRG